MTNSDCVIKQAVSPAISKPGNGNILCRTLDAFILVEPSQNLTNESIGLCQVEDRTATQKQTIKTSSQISK